MTDPAAQPSNKRAAARSAKTNAKKPKKKGTTGKRAADKKRSGRQPKRRLLKTGELAERSGLSRQVIYTYTTMQLIRPVATNAAGHKLFDETALVHLRLIQNLVSLGYTLRDIRQIFFKRR